MGRYIAFAIFFLGQIGSLPAQVLDSIVRLADPTILLDNGTYYLYGTSSNAYPAGFIVYTSTDLKEWKGPQGARGGYALRKGDSFGTSKFWAPQVFRYQDKFYMAYAADERIAIAIADSPLGPFVQSRIAPIVSQQKQIDPFVFFEGERAYLYHVVVGDGENKIYVAELEPSFDKVKPETLTECIGVDRLWENSEGAEWKVAEGPTVIKVGEEYLLFYSANHFRSKDYAVGYATSKSPFGPWKKQSEHPLISRRNTGQPGSGHGDLFQDKEGIWKYVFHTHRSDTSISPRKTALIDLIIKNDRSPVSLNVNSFQYLKLAPSKDQ